MATDTKAQVAELLDQDKSAKEIAEALGKTPATIYNHISNIRKDRGDTTPRKRGRPPKAKPETEGDAPKAETRKRPPASKASTAKPKAETPVEAKASNNGHNAHRFPVIRSAIEQELAEARRNVAVLEKMLETV